MPPVATRSRMVPLAAYCGPASSSSATPCRAVRVRSTEASIGSVSAGLTRRGGAGLMHIGLDPEQERYMDTDLADSVDTTSARNESWHRISPEDVPDEGRVRSVTVDGRSIA